MKPGLVMVIDPRPNNASVVVAGMLESFGVAGHPSVTATEGIGWSAAAVAPPVTMPACGAEAWTDNGDILIWTGDLFVPQHWPLPDAGNHPRRAISRALLQRLRSTGVDVLADLDGAFCGAWYDRARNRWAIFNDRLGLLPVFWADTNDRLVIGPTAWVTWQGSGQPLAIDENGVTDVLRTLNVTQDHTLIKGVHWLIGGHVLFRDSIDADTHHVQVHKYWELRPRPRKFSSQDEAMDAYADGLERTLKRQADGATSLLLGISGGMDSRMILAACHALHITPDCFSAGWPFDEDVRLGRRLARAAGASHTFVQVDTARLHEQLAELIVETDGLHGASHMVIGSAVPALLAEHPHSVLLEGYVFGALGGQHVPAAGDEPIHGAPHQCRWAAAQAHSGGTIDLVNSLLKPDLARTSFERWKSQIDDRYRQAPECDPLERAEYTIINSRSGRVDVLGLNACRHHAAVRSPSTAGVLLDWWARTPSRWRRGKQLFMEILRRRYPRFARVPRANCGGLPMTSNRLLREYCWQAEKLYRFWAKWRYPQVRRWSVWGKFNVACAFEAWRKAGDLGRIVEPDARVLEWVYEPALRALWRQALRDPNKATPILALGTIETMVRFLEQLAPLQQTHLHNAHSQPGHPATGVLQCASS